MVIICPVLPVFLHVLGRTLAPRLPLLARGLAAFLRAGAIGLPVSTAGRAATAATVATAEVPATGRAAAGHPTSSLGVDRHNHRHTHQDQATPGCPGYPSLRSHS